MKKWICIFTLLLSILFPAQAQHENKPDTISSGFQPVEFTFQPKSLILPASLITIGAIGTAIDGMNDFHLFSRKDSVRSIKVDNYLEWGLLGWVFICDLIGKEKHSFVDQLFVLGIAEGLNAGMVHTLKNLVKVRRPDNNPFSFPSGHTSNAFLGAHLAYKEFKDSNPWLAYSGYLMAGFVGYSRIHNNRHWLADVIAGAGVGILSVELAYLIYFPIRNAIAKSSQNKRLNNFILAPSINQNGGGLFLSYTF